MNINIRYIKIYRNIYKICNLTMQLIEKKKKKKNTYKKKNIYLRLPIKLRKEISENLPFNYRNVEENKNHHWSRWYDKQGIYFIVHYYRFIVVSFTHYCLDKNIDIFPHKIEGDRTEHCTRHPPSMTKSMIIDRFI